MKDGKYRMIDGSNTGTDKMSVSPIFTTNM